MPKGIVFNQTNDITYVIADGEATDPYLNRLDVLLSPDFSPVAGFASKYWRRNGNLLELKNQAERDQIDADELEARLAALRTFASQIKDASTTQGVEWRALVLMLLDEFNNIRQWLQSSKSAVAGAANLAGLKTAWAVLPDTPDRTVTQVKTVYQNKIDAKSAD